MSIIIDDREKEGTIAVLRKILGPETKVDRLASADFKLTDKCGHTIGIERKTASDLLGSLTKKQAGKSRLVDQLDRMREEYDRCALLLEGGVACEPTTLKAMALPARRVSGWWYGAVQMLLLRFLRSGIVRMNTTDLYSTAHLLRVLRDKAERGCLLPNFTILSNESETDEDVSDE